MFIDFVSYIELREDLYEEDILFITSEIEKYQKKYGMKKDGIKYYQENSLPGLGFEPGCSFYIQLHEYTKYFKRFEYNSYFEGVINVKDAILDYYNNERIKWVPVEEGYPNSSRQVLCTYKYNHDNGPEYEVEIGEYWDMTEEAMKSEEYGFGRRHKNVIAWAELPKPFIPD